MGDELQRTEMYMSLFYAVVDAERGLMRYANAGHPQAFLVPGGDGVPRRLKATAPPFGLAPGQAKSLWAQAQKLFHDESSYIVWGQRHSTSGVAGNVRGWDPGWIYPLGDMKVWNWWLA